MFELSGKKIWVTGHRGMVGGALVRALSDMDCDILTTTRDQVDLTRQAEVKEWMEENQPDVVIVAAAKVGGIEANRSYPADFIYDNLMIAANVIHASHSVGVDKLLFLGSSCIYPKHADQPMAEDALLTGPLEQTNQWYAIAKISGIKLCQAYRRQHNDDFISAMPTNLYGPGDNFHPEHSHVPAALLDRFHRAKMNDKDQVTVWGTGNPKREFLHVDDLADACIHLLQHYSGEGIVNIGTGQDISIADFAHKVKSTVGFDGELVFDTDKPDGTPRKLLDVSKLHDLGWRHQIDLDEGLSHYYDWYLDNIENLRAA
jgi:GDP-L-fucose synthase